MMKGCGGNEVSSNKIFYSDPMKNKLVCMRTYKLLISMKRLGLKFEIPLQEILSPLSIDGMMLDKFTSAFIRVNNEK